MAAKIFTDDERRYYKPTLKKLLACFEDGQEYYTHYFDNRHKEIGYTFTSDRPLLRRALRTLEQDGLIENINLGCNIHKWKLTKKIPA